MVNTRSSAKDNKHPSTPSPRSSKKLPPSSSSTGKKQKNRVAATQSPSRLVPLPPVLQSPDQGSVSSQHSTTPSRSSQGPLTLNIQKQLAQDIEKGGGIESLLTGSDQKVNSLCNSRQEVYGRRGHPIRRKIQNKIYRWKALYHQGKYADQVLNRFQVKSFPNLRFEEREQGKTTELDPKKKEDTVSSSDSDSSDSDSESGTSSIGSISSDHSPLPERLFEKGNSPAVPRSVETRVPQEH
jgi:hypothetical protein